MSAAYLKKIKESAHELMRKVHEAPERKRAKVFDEEVAKLPPDMRDTVSAIACTIRTTNPSEKKFSERQILLVVAVFFLIAFLAISIAIPNPSVSQAKTFRTVLALVAGVCGIFIPGAISVSVKGPGWALRGSCAAAFFLIVYLINPV